MYYCTESVVCFSLSLVLKSWVLNRCSVPYCVVSPSSFTKRVGRKNSFCASPAERMQGWPSVRSLPIYMPIGCTCGNRSINQINPGVRRAARKNYYYRFFPIMILRVVFCIVACA